uniref:LOW QUALITY PROTEIN: nuclear pore complex protein NUP50A-like n=1 Tax=Cicer arietinum TaxID=3827 RepID=A0A3Q7YC92_CICAR|nr:LOW QUALITY PROTEIN: nuclear pore complex protein NUP50A-like [Cicer arietinum]
MGDSEDAFPSSKKRAAGRELTRDTPLDDDEEDSADLDAGTFKRASDEVLATRRIIKVARRQQTNSAPSSNPFAAIRLAAPAESNAKPGEAATVTQPEKAKDEETKQPEGETREVEDKSTSNNDAAEKSNEKKELAEKESDGDNKSKVDNEQSKDGNKIENEDKKNAADKESVSVNDIEQSTEEKNTENNDKNENSESKDKEDNKVSNEPTAEGGALKSFQQLSSSQNAFTGLAGTGFSSSLFSFGPISSDGSALGSGSGSIFGMKTDRPLGLGLSNTGSSVTKSDGSGVSTLQEVVVETGEENEEVVFNADSVLFEFADGGWKERGKGEVKVNVTSGTEKKARVLMRSRGNYRLILNARLYPEMKLTNMEKKGVTFGQQTNPAPSSHPFAAIRLAAPAESNAKPGEAATVTQPEKAKDEETKQPEGETREVEDKSTSNNDAAEKSNEKKELAEKESDGDNKSKVDNEQSKDGNKIENEDKKNAADKESVSVNDIEQSTEEKNTENNDKNENSESKDKEDNKVSNEPTAEGGALKSFQQLSSSQNAFTGLAGTGFSSSLFSFGPISSDGSALGSGSGSIFGMKTDRPLGLGLSNTGSSVTKSDGSGVSTLQEVVVETGEENEEVVFNADSVLFEFADGGWKERGKGEVKVNVTSGTEKKARVLMRSRGNYRLILNARLYPEMKLTNMEKKGVTFACATEGKDCLSTFALKFKDGSIVDDFKTAITAHKGEAAYPVIKTPENSPKACDV